MPNPFLRNMPMVAVAQNVKVVNGEVIKTPLTESRRVFFRVPNNRTYPPLAPTKEIMPSQRVYPDPFMFHMIYQF